MSCIVNYLIVLFLLLFPSLTYAQESNLYLSEIMAKPDDTNEWVEIYNPTDQAISLDGWKIKDGNTSASDDLTLSGNIDPKSYKTFDHPKGWLNDSSDETVNLLQNDNVVDSYSYKTATSGKTFSKISGSWVSETNPTKGSTNIAPSPTPSNSSTPIPTPTPSISPTSTNIFAISDIPEEIYSTDLVTVSVQINISSSPTTTFYLKPALRKQGSSNYFGLTKVGDSWVKNSDSFSKQFKITTNDKGEWNGKIEFKVDAFDSGYDGEGEYLIKVGRYSETGDGPTWSNDIALKIKVNAIQAEELEDSEDITLSFSTPKTSPTTSPSSKYTDIKIPDEVYSLENYKSKMATISNTASVSGVATKSANKVYQLSYKEIEWTPILIGGAFMVIGLFIYFRIKSKNEDY